MIMVVTGATFRGRTLVTKLAKCQQVVRLLSRDEKKAPAMQADCQELLSLGNVRVL
jgi:uncharacterized protein YbjT (DUF2867 family)